MRWQDVIRNLFVARSVGRLAGAGVALGLLLALGSLALVGTAGGVPAWAWLCVACACLLLREAHGAVVGHARGAHGTPGAVRRGPRPR